MKIEFGKDFKYNLVFIMLVVIPLTCFDVFLIDYLSRKNDLVIPVKNNLGTDIYVRDKGILLPERIRLVK